MQKLTDLDCRKAKPKESPYKIIDGGGMYMMITATGSKLWRYNYRHDGKQKTLAIGAYPDVPLSLAREKHIAARAKVAAGIDPSEDKQAAKEAGKAENANTVQAVSEKWLLLHSAKVAANTAASTRALLENNLFPALGTRPITSVTKKDLLPVLQAVEARGAGYSAHRLLERCGQIWRLAIADEVTDKDPTATLKGLLKPFKVQHMPAITDPAKLGDLLRAMHNYTGSPVTVAALKLAPILFVRTGELRHAKWADIDLEAGEWAYVASKTKTEHIVPLPTQAVAILLELQPLTGSSDFVFHGARSKTRPMSENTINAALRYLGFSGDEVVGHGFRATARTILDEVLCYPPHVIEQQLSHAVRDPLGRAYNRTAHLPQRKTMLQEWADYLDTLRQGGTVLEFKRA
jgi:integrase